MAQARGELVRAPACDPEEDSGGAEEADPGATATH